MSNRFFVILASSAVAAFVASGATAQTTSAEKLEVKICKGKTKTMGCAVEEGLAAIAAGVRGDAVAAGGPLPGKCEIDSPGIAPARSSTVVLGVTCDDPSLADTGDTMIALCKSAAATARGNCKATCSKLNKIDSVTGDPISEVPCFYVVDRTIVTTATDNHGPRFNDAGQEGCGLSCTASIVCVCDP